MTLKNKIFALLRKKRVSIPLITTVAIIVILLLASPFLPQVQSNAQHFTGKHPAIAKLVPPSFRPPNLDIPRSGNWLIIPKAAIKIPIVEGDSINVLIKRVGVWHQTGDINHNYVIAGHKLQYFRSVNESLYHLNVLRPGDGNIIVVLDGIAHYYRVNTASIVKPTDIAILNPTTSPRLTIYTCNDFFNHTRFVITAQPV